MAADARYRRPKHIRSGEHSMAAFRRAYYQRYCFLKSLVLIIMVDDIFPAPLSMEAHILGPRAERWFHRQRCPVDVRLMRARSQRD